MDECAWKDGTHQDYGQAAIPVWYTAGNTLLSKELQ